MAEPDYEADMLRAQRDELKQAVATLAAEKMRHRQRAEKLEKDVEFLRESRHGLILHMEKTITRALQTAVDVKIAVELNLRKLKVHDGELDEDDDGE